MRSIIIKIFGTAISFYVTSTLIEGFRLNPTWQSYILASFLFVLTNGLAGPIIKLVLLPINLLTLGLFRWLSNVLVLYLFDMLYDGISITSYQFAGYSSEIIALPAGHLSLFWVLVLSSLVISLTYSVIGTLFSSE